MKAPKNKTHTEGFAASEVILSAVFNMPREYLLAHPEAVDAKMTPAFGRKIAAMQKRLLNGEPLAYVLGEKWFYGHRFAVNKDVLIPRPETELLVDAALAAAKENPKAAIFDIGTGSGAIAVSVAAASGRTVNAIDVSPKALAVAQKNAKAILGAKFKLVRFAHSNLLQKIPAIPAGAIIAANLPYLSKRELAEPSIKHEPRLALHGSYGNDMRSSAAIIALLKQIAAKRKGGVNIFLEINSNQAKTIAAQAEKLFPEAHISVIKDYGGFNRIITIKTKKI